MKREVANTATLREALVKTQNDLQAERSARAQLQTSLNWSEQERTKAITERDTLRAQAQARVRNDTVMNTVKQQQEPILIRQLRAENASLKKQLAEKSNSPPQTATTGDDAK